MLNEFYSVSKRESLAKYLKVYLPLVENVAERFGINLPDKEFHPDHLGVQVISQDEFDKTSHILSRYSTLIFDHVIHRRRNRLFKFTEGFDINGKEIQRVEIFEPKPEADVRKLRPGIEHIAFKVDNYEEFLKNCKEKNVPIDKEAEYEKGSFFFKTRLIDLVEIEFRNDFLGVK